jgi:hypothetical protein
MCGSAEVDGYVFASGLHKLAHPLDYDSELEDRIRPIMYLIRGAIFRRRLNVDVDLSEQHSLGELLDMYHTRKAGRRHDKIYALLGMSSEASHSTDHLYDYDTPWEQVFKLLLGFLLPQGLTFQIPKNSEIAVICGRGYVLGRVWDVKRDLKRFDRQIVTIRLTNSPVRESTMKEVEWTLQATAKTVHLGDIVCILQGASKPSLIRLEDDRLVIIAIACTPWESKQSYHQPEIYLTSHRGVLRDFRLVWDWSEGICNDTTTTMETQMMVPDFPTSDSADFLRNMVSILQEGGAYHPAEDYFDRLELQYAQNSSQYALIRLERLESRASMSMRMNKLEDAEDFLSQAVGLQQNVRQDTLSGLADLAWRHVHDTGHSASLYHIPDQIEQRLPITEDQLICAGYLFNLNLLTFLLKSKACIVDITEKVVIDAVEAQTSPLVVLSLLLEHRGDQVQITDRVVEAAARGPHAKDVMSLLLEQRGDEITITEEVVKFAVENKDASGAACDVMSLLLQRRGEEIRITKELLEAAAGNRWSGPQVVSILLEQQRDGIEITQKVMRCLVSTDDEDTATNILPRFREFYHLPIDDTVYEAAATAGRDRILDILQGWQKIPKHETKWHNIAALHNAAEKGDLGMVEDCIAKGTSLDSADIYGVTPLSRAADRGKSHVVRRLLSTGSVDINARDDRGWSPIFYACNAGGHFRGNYTVQMLVDAGAALDYMDNNGNSLSDILKWARGPRELFEILAKAKANIQMDGKESIVIRDGLV